MEKPPHIDYHKFSRGESCAEEGCRARKWYIEDGKKFCQRGHEEAGFTQTQQDEDDWNTQGKKSRKKREEKERVETVLSGSEARELYLECYQLVLWKQVHWLVTVKDFPKDLETVVRDLWGLRLGVLRKEREGRIGYSTTVGTEMFSTTSESEETDTGGSRFKSMSSRRSRRRVRGQEERLPKLIETLAILHLGMLLMRLPTSLGELYKWVIQDDIIYSRAIKEVPKIMRSKLPAYFHSALEIRAPFKGSALYRTVVELVEFYHFHFEMVFPPLNTPLLLFQHVRNLGLPVEIYPAVRRLARILEIDFAYPILHKRSYGLTPYPEIQLISLIVIATKLSQPFDNINRIPEGDTDPTTVKIDWKKWQEIMAKTHSNGLKRGTEILVADGEVLGMSEQGVDDYLDWYQRMWIDDRDPKMAEQILELFPLPDLPPRLVEDTDSELQIDHLKEVQYNLILQKPKPLNDSDIDDKRPGELYRRFRKIKDLPEDAKPFYELAAANAGISLKTLVRGVVQTEIQLQNWSLADRKRRVMKEQLDPEE